MRITGRGVVLDDVWGEDPRAYLGITVPGFPNLFCLYGPNTNPVVGSVIVRARVPGELHRQGDRRACSSTGAPPWSAGSEVHDAYNERVDAEHEQLVWRHPRVHSYYNNEPAGSRRTCPGSSRLLAHDAGTGARRLRVLGQEVGLTRPARRQGRRSSPARHPGSVGRPRCASPRRGPGWWSSTSTSRAGAAWSTRSAPPAPTARLVVGDVSTLDGRATRRWPTRSTEFGRLDVLVNNAGIVQGDDRDTWDTTEETWDRRPAGQPAERVRVLEGGDPGDAGAGAVRS